MAGTLALVTTIDSRSKAQMVADLSVEERRALLGSLTPTQREALIYDWGFWSRPSQRAPEGDWDWWIYLAGRGCIAGASRVFLPDEDAWVPVQDLVARDRPVRVLSLTSDGPRAMQTHGAPFLKGFAGLFDMVLADGRTLRVTDQHRFLSPQGWIEAGTLRVGHLVAVASFAPPVRDEGGRHSTRTLPDSLADCRPGFRSGGGPLPGALEGARASSLLPGDALERSRWWLADGQADRRVRSHACPVSGRPSMLGSSRLEMQSIDGVSPTRSSALGQPPQTLRAPGPSDEWSAPLPPIRRSDRVRSPDRCACSRTDASGTAPSLLSLEERLLGQLGRARPSDTPRRIEALALSAAILRRRVESPPEPAPSLVPYRYLPVVAIIPRGRDAFYDMTVPGSENYLAEGIWNHNTGKSRSGAEHVRQMVEREGRRRIAFVAPTAADARDVMVEGPSGILAVSPPEWLPIYEPSKRRLTWPNGARATIFSADKPNRLRGPEHDGAWGDEFASWRYPEAFENLVLGLRRGDHPTGVLTTTPKPTKLLKELIAGTAGVKVAITRGSTFENADNLAGTFLRTVLARYENTRLGRQEIYAEILEDVEGAMWKSELLERHRVALADAPKAYKRIVVSIDPSWGTKGDEVGIVVVARGHDDRGYVLEDCSGHMVPAMWGHTAAEAFDRWRADRIVAETAFGAETVRLVVKTVNEERVRARKSLVTFKEIKVNRGKQLRAEPVLALYEQGRISHVGTHGSLEQQMCSWVPEGDEASDFSPDRIDALVHGLAELFVLGASSGPATAGTAAGLRLPPRHGYGRR